MISGNRKLSFTGDSSATTSTLTVAGSATTASSSSSSSLVGGNTLSSKDYHHPYHTSPMATNTTAAISSQPTTMKALPTTRRTYRIAVLGYCSAVHYQQHNHNSNSAASLAGGAGKSCLCQRMVHPAEDDYTPNDHPSVLNFTDFSGSPVINNEHFLYWGCATRPVRRSQSSTDSNNNSNNLEYYCFDIVEQTEFVDDADFQTHRVPGGGKTEPYAKRSTRTSLATPPGAKLQYFGRNQLGVEQEYPQTPMLPSGGVGEHAKAFQIDGFIVCYDVSSARANIIHPAISSSSAFHHHHSSSQQNIMSDTAAFPASCVDQSELVLKLLQSLYKQRKPIVLATTKNDEQYKPLVRDAEKLVGRKEFKGSIPLVETSAHRNVNILSALMTLAQLIDRSNSSSASSINTNNNAGSTASSKPVAYAEACRLQGEKLAHTSTQFDQLLRTTPVPNNVMSYKIMKQILEKDDLFCQFVELFGESCARRKVEQHLHALSERQLHARQQQWLNSFRTIILPKLVPDIRVFYDFQQHATTASWQDFLKLLPSFSQFFYADDNSNPDIGAVDPRFINSAAAATAVITKSPSVTFRPPPQLASPRLRISNSGNNSGGASPAVIERIPESILYHADADKCFASFLQTAQTKLRFTLLCEDFSHLLRHDLCHIVLPGRSLHDVMLYLRQQQSDNNLSAVLHAVDEGKFAELGDDKKLELYAVHQRQLIERAKIEFKEFMWENIDAFLHVLLHTPLQLQQQQQQHRAKFSRKPTDINNTAAVASLRHAPSTLSLHAETNVIESLLQSLSDHDDRYRVMNYMAQERDKMLTQHVWLLRSSWPEVCPGPQSYCADLYTASVLDIAVPSTPFPTSMMTIDAEVPQLLDNKHETFIIVGGSEQCERNFHNRLHTLLLSSAENDDLLQLEMDNGVMYPINIVAASTTAAAVSFDSSACHIFIYNNLESLEALYMSLHRQGIIVASASASGANHHPDTSAATTINRQKLITALVVYDGQLHSDADAARHKLFFELFQLGINLAEQLGGIFVQYAATQQATDDDCTNDEQLITSLQCLLQEHLRRRRRGRAATENNNTRTKTLNQEHYAAQQQQQHGRKSSFTNSLGGVSRGRSHHYSNGGSGGGGCPGSSNSGRKAVGFATAPPTPATASSFTSLSLTEEEYAEDSNLSSFFVENDMDNVDAGADAARNNIMHIRLCFMCGDMMVTRHVLMCVLRYYFCSRVHHQQQSNSVGGGVGGDITLDPHSDNTIENGEHDRERRRRADRCRSMQFQQQQHATAYANTTNAANNNGGVQAIDTGNTCSSPASRTIAFDVYLLAPPPATTDENSNLHDYSENNNSIDAARSVLSHLSITTTTPTKTTIQKKQPRRVRCRVHVQLISYHEILRQLCNCTAAENTDDISSTAHAGRRKFSKRSSSKNTNKSDCLRTALTNSLLRSSGDCCGGTQPATAAAAVDGVIFVYNAARRASFAMAHAVASEFLQIQSQPNISAASKPMPAASPPPVTILAISSAIRDDDASSPSIQWTPTETALIRDGISLCEDLQGRWLTCSLTDPIPKVAFDNFWKSCWQAQQRKREMLNNTLQSYEAASTATICSSSMNSMSSSLNNKSAAGGEGYYYAVPAAARPSVTSETSEQDVVADHYRYQQQQQQIDNPMYGVQQQKKQLHTTSANIVSEDVFYNNSGQQVPPPLLSQQQSCESTTSTDDDDDEDDESDSATDEENEYDSEEDDDDAAGSTIVAVDGAAGGGLTKINHTVTASDEPTSLVAARRKSLLLINNNGGAGAAAAAAAANSGMYNCYAAEAEAAAFAAAAAAGSGNNNNSSVVELRRQQYLAASSNTTNSSSNSNNDAAVQINSSEIAGEDGGKRARRTEAIRQKFETERQQQQQQNLLPTLSEVKKQQQLSMLAGGENVNNKKQSLLAPVQHLATAAFRDNKKISKENNSDTFIDADRAVDDEDDQGEELEDDGEEDYGPPPPLPGRLRNSDKYSAIMGTLNNNIEQQKSVRTRLFQHFQQQPEDADGAAAALSKANKKKKRSSKIQPHQQSDEGDGLRNILFPSSSRTVAIAAATAAAAASGGGKFMYGGHELKNSGAVVAVGANLRSMAMGRNSNGRRRHDADHPHDISSTSGQTSSPSAAIQLLSFKGLRQSDSVGAADKIATAKSSSADANKSKPMPVTSLQSNHRQNAARYFVLPPMSPRQHASLNVQDNESQSSSLKGGPHSPAETATAAAADNNNTASSTSAGSSSKSRNLLQFASFGGGSGDAAAGGSGSKLRKSFDSKKRNSGKKNDPSVSNNSAPICLPADTFEELVIDAQQRSAGCVPKFIELCVEFLEHGPNRAMEMEGLYRIPGNRAQALLLMADFYAATTTMPTTTSSKNKKSSSAAAVTNASDIGKLFNIPSETAVTTVCTALKIYLNDRTPPLLPKRLVDALLASKFASLTTLAEKVALLRRSISCHSSNIISGDNDAVSLLTPANYAALKYIAAHLQRVSRMAHVNMMTAKNLSICWWPTCCRLDVPDLFEFERVRAVLEDAVAIMIDEQGSVFSI